MNGAERRHMLNKSLPTLKGLNAQDSGERAERCMEIVDVAVKTAHTIPHEKRVLLKALEAETDEDLRQWERARIDPWIATIVLNTAATQVISSRTERGNNCSSVDASV